MEPFNQYLTRNPKPRYLVFQFSSPNLNEFKPGVAFLDHFDGIIQSLRYYGWRKTLPLFLHNPDYFFGMLNYTYRSGLTEMVLTIRGKRPKPDEKHRDSYLIYPRPPLESCPIYNGGDAMPSQTWVAYLRQHYSALAEHVLVDVSPTSPCAALYPQWKAHLGHATDNELELYPNHLFVDGTFHLSREGAIRRSNELAEQILQAEKQRNAAGASNLSGGNEAPAGGEKD
jgi:hypothetical protein